MDKNITKNIIAYASNEGNPETYIQEQFLKHQSYGKSFWEQVLEESEKHTYSTSNSHLKDRLKNYCATRLQDVSHEEELKNRVQQKDIEIADLTRSNLKLQNDYLPHAIQKESKWKTYYWIGIIASIGGTLLGVWLGNSLSDNQKQSQIQGAILIHDTVYSIKYDTLILLKKDTIFVEKK